MCLLVSGGWHDVSIGGVTTIEESQYVTFWIFNTVDTKVLRNLISFTHFFSNYAYGLFKVKGKYSFLLISHFQGKIPELKVNYCRQSYQRKPATLKGEEG
jgi:hypothetical protein